MFRLAGGTITLPDLFDATLLAPAFMMLLHPALRSYATDPAVAVVLFTGGSLMVRVLTERGTAPEPIRALRVGVAGVLMASAVAIKLSAVGFAGPGLVLLLWWWLKHDPAAGSSAKRVLVVVVAFSSLLGASWAVRGAVLSGYPAYPSTVLRMPVSWAVPAEQAEAEQAWVMHTARYEAGEFGTGWSWFKPWVGRLWEPYPVVRFVFPLILAAVALLALVFPVGRAPPDRAAWWLLAPIVTGMAFWFLTAPSVRFGFTFAWLLAALMVGQAILRFRDTVRPRPVVIGLTLLALVPVGFPVARYMASESPSAGEILRFSSYVVVVRPNPDSFLYPMPTTALEPYTTATGLVVNVPSDGETCWRAAIPCTPHPTQGLASKRQGDLASGFLSTGSWQPEQWPATASAFLPWWRCQSGYLPEDDPACRAHR